MLAKGSDGAHGQLVITAHQMNLLYNVRELIITNIAQLDETTRVSLTKQAICDIFGVSLEVISTFDNNEERS